MFVALQKVVHYIVKLFAICGQSVLNTINLLNIIDMVYLLFGYTGLTILILAGFFVFQ